MGAPQLSYDLAPAAAFAGMKADSGLSDTVSRLADVALDAGLGVCKGTDTESVKLPTTEGNVTGSFGGIALYNASQMPRTANRYAATDAVPVLKRGRVWVQTEATIADDAAIYCIYDATNRGKFRADADTNRAGLVPSAKCIKGVTGAGLALIEINLP